PALSTPQPPPPLSASPCDRRPSSHCPWYFFFQAEDGIRDRNVTGVQTCALPISISSFSHTRGHAKLIIKLRDSNVNLKFVTCARSEERRVGKECRSRWAPDQQKKNRKVSSSSTQRHRAACG